MSPLEQSTFSAEITPPSPVFVADVLRLQAGDAVAALLPADDGIVIFRRRVKIAEGRMLRPPDHGLLNGGRHGKIHVRDPHGDHVEALPGGGIGRTGRAHCVDGNGVLSPAIQNGSKVVFHLCFSFFCAHPAGVAGCKNTAKNSGCTAAEQNNYNRGISLCQSAAACVEGKSVFFTTRNW